MYSVILARTFSIIPANMWEPSFLYSIRGSCWLKARKLIDLVLESGARSGGPVHAGAGASVLQYPQRKGSEEIPRKRADGALDSVDAANAVATFPIPIVIVPGDLSDVEIDALLAAVTTEAERRGRRPPSPAKEKPVADAKPQRRQEAAQDGAGSLTPGKLNAVRAAFKAGVKPSAIARHFPMSEGSGAQVSLSGCPPSIKISIVMAAYPAMPGTAQG